MSDERADFLLEFRRRAAWMVFTPAVIAAVIVSAIVYNVMLRDYTRNIEAGIVNLASNALRDGVSAENAQGLEQLSGFVATLLKARSYLQVVVLDPAGERVFAECAEGGECMPVSDDDFSAALGGRMVARIERLNGTYAVHVVAPLKSAEGEPPPGVLSGYRPLRLLLSGVVDTITLLAATVIGFAFVAYALLRHFTARAAEQIELHDAQVTQLESRLNISLQDLERHSLGTLQALTAAVDAKDAYTARHSLNVADYAVALARAMGHEELVPILERAGLLHDIGKIGVSEQLLQKPGSLSPDEFAAVAEHSRLGAGIIEMIPFLHDVVPAVLYHHERWDGTGYPERKSGEAIPLAARILATADAFDAMTTTRPYRAAMTTDAACREMERCSGTQFDPDTVDALLGWVRSPVGPRALVRA